MSVAAIRLQRLPIEQLALHPRNPRKHPEPGSPLWAALKRSLAHDYFDPLVWNERNGFLVSGHFRRKVMEMEGVTLVDVSVVEYDEPTHYARMIAANRPLGEWEDEVLRALAGEIEEAGLDAALAGYDEKSLMALVSPPEAEGDDEAAQEMVTKAEQLQQKWQVQPGQLYQIGAHRLLCGASESLHNWQRLLQGGDKADMIWCDPPYNVAYDASMKKRNEIEAAGGETSHVKPVTILNDNVSAAAYLDLLHAWFTAAAAVVKPGGACYVAHAEAYGHETRAALKAAGFHVAQCIIWVKQAWTLGRQDYQWQHEPILYGWLPGAGHYWQGGYSQSTVIDDEQQLKKLSKAELVALVNHLRNSADTTVVREPRNTVSELHPTVKPVRLVARQIWNSSRRGETVAELFGGSGTTFVAAELHGRRCIGTELDPKFCAVILERLTSLGLQARLCDGC